MPATTPPPIATTLALLPVAAFPVLEGWSAELTLTEAAEMDETAELNTELWLLKADASELCAADAAADAAEDAADKAEKLVLYRY